MLRTIGIIFLTGLLAGPAFAKADARPRTAPAKGTKECVIGQYVSEYLKEKHAAAVAQAKVPFYMQTSSYLKFNVQKSGAVNVSIADDTYPGSMFYFMIGGKRYAGEARFQLPLDAAALAALRQDKLINFTYTDWPDRAEISREDIFSGFAKAYDDCLVFLGGTAKPPGT